jgi:hypothetical protein
MKIRKILDVTELDLLIVIRESSDRFFSRIIKTLRIGEQFGYGGREYCGYKTVRRRPSVTAKSYRTGSMLPSQNSQLHLITQPRRCLVLLW